MRVEKPSGRPTSPAAARMRGLMPPEPFFPRWRKTFSTMMAVDSTTIPKSTAPSEMRLAGVPVRTMPAKAAHRASGMFTAVTSAALQLPRKKARTSVTSPMPTSTFSITVRVVRATSAPRS
jgi:hypothetical protein